VVAVVVVVVVVLVVVIAAAANKSTDCAIPLFPILGYTNRCLSVCLSVRLPCLTTKFRSLFAVLNFQTTFHAQFTAKCMPHRGTRNYNFIGEGGSI
jgi:hypothetical protein